MRRILTAFLAALLVLSFLVCAVACGDNKPVETTGGSSTPEGDPLAGTYDITVWVSELAGVKELTGHADTGFLRG